MITLGTIGLAVREARKEKGMTQAELASAVGLGRATLSQFENGIVRELGIRKVLRLLDRLGLELSTRPAGAPPTLEELREER